MRRLTLLYAIAIALGLSASFAFAEPLCSGRDCFQLPSPHLGYQGEIPSLNQIDNYQDHLNAVNTLLSPYGDQVEPVFPDSNFHEF